MALPQMKNGFTQYPENIAASLQVSDLVLLDAFFEQISPVGEIKMSHLQMLSTLE